MRPIIPALQPVYTALAEPAYALVRFVAGVFLVPHGMWKLFGITGSQEEMAAFFSNIGLEPAWPLMILVGDRRIRRWHPHRHRFPDPPGGALAAITTGTAALYVHLPLGFYVEPGGVEFSGLWAIVLLMIAVAGRRAFLDRSADRPRDYDPARLFQEIFARCAHGGIAEAAGFVVKPAVRGDFQEFTNG